MKERGRERESKEGSTKGKIFAQQIIRTFSFFALKQRSKMLPNYSCGNNDWPTVPKC